ncbi:non-heme iron oxygenase ferredoxin subunit [Novosphingobium sp. YJ-S2-02]|uniref:Non-heme iron oxygenase ferredoxin subunit n=1 Tax=Novosphingobium aureum TaxID=2792964 RepID=A0A931HDG3_9SPHN|nr:non-heme iron oxygenase ferredoxin subunit [Novosphingobium aureum]MBH0114072.1 non-heme iron oxygenase ferredoxin subunit [Novosphingobium aureum]
MKICAVEDLAPGAIRLVELDGMDPLVLVNRAGEFFLLEDECTHAIASLSEGRLEGDTLFCPLHGGSFDVRTGKAKSLPCKMALNTFPVEVRDGAVWYAG